MKIDFNGKIIEILVKEVGFFGKVFGLMFRTKNTKNLLFNFSSDVKLSLHSWFVFFSFYALWLDKNNNVIFIRKITPFTTIISCSKKFRKIIEIPINKRNKSLICFLDGKEKHLNR